MGMADNPTKDELLSEAREAGLDVSDSDTKANIEAALVAHRGDDALGPHENEDGIVGGFTPDKNPIQAVAPETYDEVPEGLR